MGAYADSSTKPSSSGVGVHCLLSRGGCRVVGPGGVVGPTASRRGPPCPVSDPPFPVVTTRSPDPRCCRTGQGTRRCRHRRASRRGEDRSAMDPRMSGTTASAAGRRFAHTPLRGQWTGRFHARSAQEALLPGEALWAPPPLLVTPQRFPLATTRGQGEGRGGQRCCGQVCVRLQASLSPSVVRQDPDVTASGSCYRPSPA